MRELARDGRKALAFESLIRRPEVRHLFTTRNRDGGGNVSLSGGRDAAAALEERRFWSKWLEVSAEDWVVGGQTHGTGITAVEESHRGRGALSPELVIPDSDGLVTLERGLPLYVAVADCTAALLLMPGEQPALGLTHAGWRGLRDGVLQQAVARICAHSGREVSELLAGVSPCIGLVHFEVGEEVADHAPDRRRVKIEGRWHVDLAGWANEQLLQAGLRQGQIEVSGLDTHERADLFFSHRRDGEGTGRMGLIAVLADEPAAAGPPRG